MAKDKKLRIGMIGCGKIARTLHLAEYATCPDAEVVAYCDVDPISIAETVERTLTRVETAPAQDLAALVEADAAARAIAREQVAAIRLSPAGR